MRPAAGRPSGRRSKRRQASTLAGSSRRRAIAPHARHHLMRAARPAYDARSARTADASDNGLRHPARYGQNDREIVLNRKMRCSLVTIKGRRTGRPSPHLSRPANCMVSIQPTSPTCSQSSSISGLHRASTSSCLGVGQHSVPPIASRRNHEGDSRSRSIQRKNQAIGTVRSENRLPTFCPCLLIIPNPPPPPASPPRTPGSSS